MIKEFGDRRTERFFHGSVKTIPWSRASKVAARKLDMLDSAAQLGDLRSPPGNRLEALNHDRLGQYSIRINDQWRVCFRWSRGHAFDVEITDYH